jgi:hypothetical protein
MGHRERWLDSFDSNFKELRDILVVFLLKDPTKFKQPVQF